MRPLVAGSATAIRLIKLSFFPNNGMYSASPVQRMQDTVHYIKKQGGDERDDHRNCSRNPGWDHLDDRKKEKRKVKM